MTIQFSILIATAHRMLIITNVHKYSVSIFAIHPCLSGVKICILAPIDGRFNYTVQRLFMVTVSHFLWIEYSSHHLN